MIDYLRRLQLSHLINQRSSQSLVLVHEHLFWPNAKVSGVSKLCCLRNSFRGYTTRQKIWPKSDSDPLESTGYLSGKSATEDPSTDSSDLERGL